LRWQSLGAPRLHIVDLDGAATGVLHNLHIITEIASALLIPTQLGGGIRQLQTTEQLLKAGIERNRAYHPGHSRSRRPRINYRGVQ